MSKRAIEANFRWSKRLRSMVKWDKIEQSKSSPKDAKLRESKVKSKVLELSK